MTQPSQFNNYTSSLNHAGRLFTKWKRSSCIFSSERRRTYFRQVQRLRKKLGGSGETVSFQDRLSCRMAAPGEDGNSKLDTPRRVAPLNWKNGRNELLPLRIKKVFVGAWSRCPQMGFQDRRSCCIPDYNTIWQWEHPLTLTLSPRWGEGNKRIALSHAGAREILREGEDENTEWHTPLYPPFSWGNE